MQFKQVNNPRKKVFPAIKKKVRVKHKASKIFTKPPAYRKLGELGKIGNIININKICSSFGVPFEPITVFRRGQRFDINKFRGSKRIIVRTGERRKDFVLKGTDKNKRELLGDKIKEFAEESERYIVQRVGLMGNIEKYGSVVIIKSGTGSIAYYSETVPKGLLQQGQVFTSPNLKEIDLGDKSSFMQKFGNHNTHAMINQLARNIGNKSLRLRFVKYREKKPCFYDMQPFN